MLPLPHFQGRPLPQSAAIIAPAGCWDALISEYRTQVHPADFWVPEDVVKPAGISEVRDLRAFLSHTRHGEWGMACVPAADRLKAEAANALLKTLEEPPAHTYLLLLTETDHLLPTIASRVRRLPLAQDSVRINPGPEAPTARSQWQRVLSRYDLSDPDQRTQAQRLLFYHSLAHSTIKTESVLNPFDSPQ
jgi:hypothetical protein